MLALFYIESGGVTNDKKADCFKGTANTGKSTTIKSICEILIKEPGLEGLGIQHDGWDICVIIIIRGIKIGIEAQGDPGSRLMASLDMFKKKGCHIIVCATRTRGGTVSAVESLEDDYCINWHEKAQAASVAKQSKENSELTALIVDEVRRLIDKYGNKKV